MEMGKREEGRGGGSAEIGLAFVARFLKTLTSFKPKCLIFSTLFTLGPYYPKKGLKFTKLINALL